MIRRWIRPFVACCALALPARAQTGASTSDVLYAAPGIAYGALSIGAIVTLIKLRDTAPVEPGQALRIPGPGGSYRRGHVVRVEGDKITVEMDGEQTVLLPENLGGMQVSLGRSGRWAQGWGIGFVTGAATGALLGFASGDDPPGTFLPFTAGEKAVFVGAALGITGSALGALIGLAGPERWVLAAPDASRRVSVSPIVGRSSGVSVRLEF
jgi:hypothetical protein